MERAWRLPTRPNTFDRYVVVDSGAAETYLFQRDRLADKMRVVVGAPATKTPMIAVLMRNAKLNPYWNVPPDLIRTLTARARARPRPLVPAELPLRGPARLDRHRADQSTRRPVNWRQVAAGKTDPTIRVRQLPGRGTRWAR